MKYNVVDITGRHSRRSISSKDQYGHQKKSLATVDTVVDYVVCTRLSEVAWVVLTSVGIFDKIKDDRCRSYVMSKGRQSVEQCTRQAACSDSV